MKSATDSQITNARAMAFLRISVGILFLIFGQYKVFGTQFTLHGGFQFWINKFLEDGAYPFMVPVLRNFVLPHATAIAFLVAYGELAIGLAFVARCTGWSRKRLWIDLHTVAAALRKLSRCPRAALAILRRLARSFGVSAVLPRFFDWKFRRHMVAARLARRPCPQVLRFAGN